MRCITQTKFKAASSKSSPLPYSIAVVNYIKIDRPTRPRTHILTDITYIYTVAGIPISHAWIESLHAQLKKNASTEHRYTIVGKQKNLL